MDINIEAAFLITEEDFVNMQIAKAKYMVPKENAVILKIMGVIAVFCGIIAFVYIRGSLYQLISWLLLIAVGLYCLFYYDLINPLITKKQAVGFYQFHQRAIGSKLFHLQNEQFSFTDEDHKITVPVDYIFELVETPDTIFIFFDQNEFGFVPKRVFQDEQMEQMRAFFKDMKKYRISA